MKRVIVGVIAICLCFSLMSACASESSAGIVDKPVERENSTAPAETTPSTTEPPATEPGHSHSYTSKITVPTCTEKGYTTYTCTCGDSYKDTEIAAMGHTEVVDHGVAATCISTGITDGVHCSVCKSIQIAQQVIDVLAVHKEGIDYDATGRSVDGYVDQIASGDKVYVTLPYIEFMDKTFGDDGGYYETKRLIIHEKTHMLYEHYFSDELKKAWQKVGGWYENPNDRDGWSTTKQTEFVSAYAHSHNPDEDMAESVATYVINPDLLRSRAPPQNLSFLEMRKRESDRLHPERKRCSAMRQPYLPEHSGQKVSE